ncbi:serine/threonine-protein kinase kin4 [Acrodontium crateriforme]|uniref:non-specific serine/threonine protein kinase n=1 Tax=Acrodontium crateriforme TaxID=150365 RepID=A0AAQ3RED7_9PEZI|nr:serine/threonine-protein kinase kin4 [Acrodontium crateriforme]
MSSAVIQHSAPQQYAQNVPGREKFPPNAVPNLSSSPPSSRRANRQNSTGNASNPSTPQQPIQYVSPPGSTGMSHPRGQSTSDIMSSPYNQYYPEQGSTIIPAAALPIRTSSQQATQSPNYDGRGQRSRAQSSGQASEPERGSDSERRRQHQSPRDDPGSARSHRSRNAPSSSRSTTAVGQPPVDTSLPRENSAIINHIVVDDPQSDIAREKARVAESRPHPPGEAPPTNLGLVTDQPVVDQRPPTQRSRQEHLKQQPSNRKEVKFGEYILGQTLGEGEFGKVKMGWKKDSSVQVAIKLIRKESLAGNTTRLPKIYREIAILRELQHPNIVRLHEFVETERHMGIILEYASGGELFDYILNHRYLKDNAARRLFAQLVSGVGYLHRKGIVHRDLKLENLLLDRNRNIIITDFGFANTFNPGDELGDEIEAKITDKEFVKLKGLDAVGSDGHRRGDLMQTSCGSPCYAAPELVVSDGLYTGRKVDVWSCGVILYAMLAGYLPFDDDPANPEGDNINLLYKYIVSTPLTFPEYVTPHARDLLRRILVPEPRRRADLFEVAHHSWLSEYSHVVGFIGSSTKSDKDIATSALHQGGEPSTQLGRSASVREPTNRSPVTMATGGIQKLPASSGGDLNDNRTPNNRDNKRRTVQVEYVAPKMTTARGDVIQSPQSVVSPTAGRTKARGDGQGPIEVRPNSQIPRKEVPSQSMGPPSRPTREQIRTVSEGNAFAAQASASNSRPNTSGALGTGARLPSRGNSYSQPAAATPTTTNVQGHFSQPKSSTGYIISSPMPLEQRDESIRPVSHQQLSQFPPPSSQPQQLPRSHKRSSTLGSIGDRILGRTNSRKQSQNLENAGPANEKRDRRYPPVSMKGPISNGNEDAQSRPSTESRRPSFGFSRKNSDIPSERRNSRRFSFLPSSFSMNSFMSNKRDSTYDAGDQYRPQSKGMAFGRGQSPAGSQSTNSTNPLQYEAEREASRGQRYPNAPPGSAYGRDVRFEKPLPSQPGKQEMVPPPRKQFRDDGYGGNLLDSPGQGQVEPPERFYTPAETADQARPAHGRSDSYNFGNALPETSYSAYPNDGYEPEGFDHDHHQGMQNIRPQQRKFADAYDQGHGGSSSSARKVMDFFRRRGKDRSSQI